MESCMASTPSPTPNQLQHPRECTAKAIHLNEAVVTEASEVKTGEDWSFLEAQKKLGHTEFKPSNLYISLADGSHKDVVGKLESLLVKIGKARIPTDFIIIKMDKEVEDPILLGRPFLATAGAIIDVKEGLIRLNISEGLTMNFDITDSSNLPTIGGQPFKIEDKADFGVLREEETSTAKVTSHEEQFNILRVQFKS
ncbi:PREDICTED: uncharacterized protein LOC104738111 [Camelina sativa]|uniref:Uncharacterized protein LOC104738111 n=1 Tax=Camelina sativa TaxID=90675 RepID=A0ABM0VID7_CAMSA|nr:PREDICTED: uncharacterized protein LOC104738111 [Camelina sativa]